MIRILHGPHLRPPIACSTRLERVDAHSRVLHESRPPWWQHTRHTFRTTCLSKTLVSMRSHEVNASFSAALQREKCSSFAVSCCDQHTLVSVCSSLDAALPLRRPCGGNAPDCQSCKTLSAPCSSLRQAWFSLPTIAMKAGTSDNRSTRVSSVPP